MHEKKTLIIPFKKLPFRHRFMFAQVMSDPEICKQFLELLLHIKIDHIEYIDTEKIVENSNRFRSIRLDVYLQDDAGTVYNIEMQAEKAAMPLKRPRYYQGQIDLWHLKQGCAYQDLPNVYIIILCDFDYCIDLLIFSINGISLGSGKLGVEGAEFYPGITGSEMPVNFRRHCITFSFPCGQFCAQFVNVIYAAIEALPGHYIKLYFSNVQPTPALWCVM